MDEIDVGPAPAPTAAADGDESMSVTAATTKTTTTSIIGDDVQANADDDDAENDGEKDDRTPQRATSSPHPVPAEPAATTATTTEGWTRVPPRFVPQPFPYLFPVTVEIDSDADLDDMGWGRGYLADEQLPPPPPPPSPAEGGEPYDADRRRAVLDGLRKGEDAAAAASHASWQVRVPFVLPGELVQVRIVKNFDTYSEADLVRVVRPSPDRVEPKCPLAGVCAGCQFQHVAVVRQRQWKADFVWRGLEEQAIVGYGGDAIRDANLLLPTLGTDQVYEYRNKLTPHYEAPARVGDGDEYEMDAIGFQHVANNQRSRLVDVEECPIATPAINARYRETRKELHEQAQAGLLNNKRQRRKHRRSKKADLGATLLFRQADDDDDGNPVVVTDSKEYMTTTVRGIKFRYLAGNFFQNNDYVTPLMVEGVLEAATRPVAGGGGAGGDDHDEKTDLRPNYLIDCYCGSGLFALSASGRFKLCVGIEVNEKAVEEAAANAMLNSIGNCQFVAASAEAIFTSPPALTVPGWEGQRLQDFPRNETVVVLDPPRKGCSGKFLEQLYEYAPQRIIYMSCGPRTQARDAKGIVEVGGYDIVSIQPYDLFPQTKHVECLMVFEKRDEKGVVTGHHAVAETGDSKQDDEKDDAQ